MENMAGGYRGAWKRLRHHPMGMIGLVMLVSAVTVAILAPWISPYDPDAVRQRSIMDIYQPPSPEHWLGTDDAGGDVLTNFLYGARVSLTVGFFACSSRGHRRNHRAVGRFSAGAPKRSLCASPTSCSSSPTCHSPSSSSR